MRSNKVRAASNAWRRFIEYARRTPWLFRLVLLVCLFMWPFFYTLACLSEAWRNDEFTHFYRYVYEAFRKGGPI